MKKNIWILTLFPEYFEPLKKCGIVGQALRGERSEGIKFELHTINIRDYAHGNYKSVDDAPFGGGPGMVMRADILEDALLGLMKLGGYTKSIKESLNVIYTSPRGKVWDHNWARSFATNELSDPHRDCVFICGRYEGIDERFLNKYVDQMFSIGDFVLSGGEIAVLSILDSALRFVPGILGNKLSTNDDSFEENHLLEAPRYTRPQDFNGDVVPEILLSGHHQKMTAFEREQKEIITQKLRPDLWKKYLETKEKK